MGESSKWIPEVKTTRFWPLGIFFPKIKVKSGKNENWPKTVKKGQKWISLAPKHCLQLFFITRARQTGQKSHFRPFRAIFGHFWCTPFELKKKWVRTPQIAIFLPNLVD